LAGAAPARQAQRDDRPDELGLLHLLWMRASKQRFDEVSVYAAIVLLLIVARLAKGGTVAWFKARRRPSSGGPVRSA
jgi:sulfoxide reductase heme-binding subunit YedZ